MNCPQCGQVLPDTSKFCSNCGTKLTPLSQTTQSAEGASTLPATGISSMPAALEENRDRANLLVNEYTPLNRFQADAEQNWLERLVGAIPGYKGYLEKEIRRDVDKLHREHLAAMLNQLKAPLNGVIRELSDNRRLFEVGPIERVLQRLDKIENRIRYASYGYSGFFDVVKIREAQLDQLYHFDVALLEYVERIKIQVQQLVAKVSDANALKATAQELSRTLDELDRKFNERFQAIENPNWIPS
ncbi:MAG: zinc ribbon domain-containing protein [Acidobacteriota bacterium]